MVNRLGVTLHTTWNESRNSEFPQVLEYRRKWQDLGFSVAVTEDIRHDVIRLNDRFPTRDFLSTFDNLETNVMRYDFWRYTILYLEGGLYADVDVEPFEGIVTWVQKAVRFNKTVFFEETSFSENAVSKFLIPLLSDYPDLPSYGNCVIVAPGAGEDLFVDLLSKIDSDQWSRVREPRRTLMTTGPGLVTVFVKHRAINDFIKVRFLQRSRAFAHHGFGTWKSWLRREEVITWSVLPILLMIFVVGRCPQCRHRWKRWCRISSGQKLPQFFK